MCLAASSRWMATRSPSEVGNGFQRRLEIAVDLTAQGGRLLDCRVLGKHQQVRARRRAVRDPTRDLIPPGFERGGLPIGYCAAAILTVSRAVIPVGPIRSCLLLKRLHPELHGVVASLPPGRCPSSGSCRRCPRGGHSRASSRSRRAGGSPSASAGGRRGARRGRRSSSVKPPSFLACASRWSKNAWPRPCPRWAFKQDGFAAVEDVLQVVAGRSRTARRTHRRARSSVRRWRHRRSRRRRAQ